MGVHRIATRLRSGRPTELEGILELFEEHVYAGVIGRDGRGHRTRGRRGAGAVPRRPDAGRRRAGRVLDAQVHGDDRDAYQRFRVRLRRGEDARGHLPPARGRRRHPRDVGSGPRDRSRRDGTVLVTGIISDVTSRREVADASWRSPAIASTGCSTSSASTSTSPSPTRTASSRSCSRGPAPTGCSAAPSRTPRWRTGRPPSTPTTAPRTTRSTPRWRPVEDADVEYRLRGADGITRWVHDRAVAHPNAGRDVRGERHRVRRHRAPAHARRARPGARRAVAGRRGDGRAPLHAPDRSRRRPPRGLPRPEPRGARGRGAARRRRRRRSASSARAPRGPTLARRRSTRPAPASRSTSSTG